MACSSTKNTWVVTLTRKTFDVIVTLLILLELCHPTHLNAVTARAASPWKGDEPVKSLWLHSALCFFWVLFRSGFYHIFLKCSHFSWNCRSRKNKQNNGKTEHNIISLAGLRQPGLLVLLLSVPETSSKLDNHLPVQKLFPLIHPIVYSTGTSFAGAGSQHWAGSEQLGCWMGSQHCCHQGRFPLWIPTVYFQSPVMSLPGRLRGTTKGSINQACFSSLEDKPTRWSSQKFGTMQVCPDLPRPKRFSIPLWSFLCRQTHFQ